MELVHEEVAAGQVDEGAARKTLNGHQGQLVGVVPDQHSHDDSGGRGEDEGDEDGKAALVVQPHAVGEEGSA